MPLEEVVQSLRLQSSNKNYTELGSCPTLGGSDVPSATRSGPSTSANRANNPRTSTGNATSSSSVDPSSRSGASRPLLSRHGIADACGVDGSPLAQEEVVQTPSGDRILVARQGDPSRPAIITYHDLALNYKVNFQPFFNSPCMSTVSDSFCVYHINAPGQESGAEQLPEDYEYPSMEKLSEQVEYVLHHYGLPHCVCFGVGLGANVLARFAHRRPTMVDGLVLINCSSQSAGWMEWVYHKVNIKNLKKQASNANPSSPSTSSRARLPDGVVEYLMWYHLGGRSGFGGGGGGADSGSALDSMSLASIYKQHFSCEVDPRNLLPLLQSFLQRSDLGLAREINSQNGKPLFGSTRSLKSPVLNMTGDRSPHVDATVSFNGRLQPNQCTWMKIRDAAMILEEQPAKVAEAVKLFLQGLGYIFRSKKSVVARKQEDASAKQTTLPSPSQQQQSPSKAASAPADEALQQQSASSSAATGNPLIDLGENVDEEQTELSLVAH